MTISQKRDNSPTTQKRVCEQVKVAKHEKLPLRKRLLDPFWSPRKRNSEGRTKVLGTDLQLTDRARRVGRETQ